MGRKVLLIAKTDLNTDGRILNEIEILKRTFDDLSLDFILLPDKPLKIDLGEKVHIHEINIGTRNSRLWRPFTVLQFSFRALFLLLKLKPVTIHAHDTAIVLPVLFYKIIKGKRVRLIYDDHELPFGPNNFGFKLFSLLEKKLMGKADFIVFANKERMLALNAQLELKANQSFFLNLPYFDEDFKEISDQKTLSLLSMLKQERKSGISFIVHQGALNYDRGRELLAGFSGKLPSNFKILLLGGSEEKFKEFITEFNLVIDHFFFIGTVNYEYLVQFWKHGSASIVMYLPTDDNNRLCAPNRFFLSIFNGIPVIVNRDNPVLKDFVVSYKCGWFIDEFSDTHLFDELLDYNSQLNWHDLEELKSSQISSFVSLYHEVFES